MGTAGRAAACGTGVSSGQVEFFECFEDERNEAEAKVLPIHEVLLAGKRLCVGLAEQGFIVRHYLEPFAGRRQLVVLPRCPGLIPGRRRRCLLFLLFCVVASIL